MLTPAQYRGAIRRLNRYEKWASQYNQPNGWRVIPADAKQPVHFDNADRSAIEVYEWHRDKPQSYLLYINEGEGTAATWAGEELGAVFMGTPNRDNYGGVWVPIDVIGTNGIKYHGTYYRSAGDYARIKAYKNQTTH